MKRILLLTRNSCGGGAERVMTHLANYLSGRSCSVVYASLLRNGYYPLHESVEKVVFCPAGEKPFRQLLYMRRYLKKNAFDAILIFGVSEAIKLRLAVMGLPCKDRLIMSERNDPGSNVTTLRKKLLRKWAYASAARMVFQTEDARRFFPKAIQDKGTVIFNPLTVKENDRQIAREPHRVIAAGRITPQKNYGMMLEAFTRFSRTFPDYVLDIYGKADANSTKEDMLRYIAAHGMGERIRLHDFSPNIADEFYGSSIYLSSSDYEGLSNSMLEAMACGAVPICTDCPCGGARAMIRPMENGLLVPVGDSEKMFLALKYLAEHPEKREEMARNATAVRSELDIETIGRLWERVIEAVRGQ